ncbi:MAG: flagellar export chaperone FliS [Geopsychrobacter sp.]|nr:flagellar export chaperone FliS [Geopsychrobacter sp.]
MNAYMNQYQNNQILTASPEQILIMLYDGAIRFVRQARQEIEGGNLGAKSTAVGKALAIITEFTNTLDYEVGGEIALDLRDLYTFMVGELVAVNARSDVEKLDSVENILCELREAWVEAARITAREKQVKSESAGISAGIAAAL